MSDLVLPTTGKEHPMGRIDWLPIEELTDELKDGRELLIWILDDFHIGSANVDPDDGSIRWWIDIEAEPITDQPTHFAELNPPN